MTSWWGSTPAQTEFDTLLEKTTSDLLPSSTPVDLAQSLQLADLIRSASVPPPASSKSLLKRLQHSNPNVQLLALQVLDVCIKNGGTPFLLQIADKDKEFYSGLEALARGTGTGGGGNRDVKEKVLEKVQEWAEAFKGKEGLRETQLVKTYERLRLEGLPFPKKDPTATAAMVDSLSAPEWQDSSYCTRCRTDFSTFNRKHHCRNCGLVFDAACSSQTSPLPHYGIVQPVRVCDGCHKKIKEGKGAQVARNQSVKSDGSSGTGGGAGKHGRSKSRKDQEDEDLRKAIEASLKESSSSSTTASHGSLREPVAPIKNSGYNPSYASNFGGTDSKSAAKRDGRTGGGGGGDEEDPDLAAAIAASLRDVAPAPTAPSFNRQDSSQPVTYAEMFPRPQYNSHDNASTPTPTSKPARLNLPNYDLDPSQFSLLNQFTSTMTPQHPGPSYLTQPEHELSNQVVRDLEPRLERSLEDTKRRGMILRELEWKLGEAARLYGAGLTEVNHVYHPPTATRTHEPHYHQQQQYASPIASVNPQYQYHSTSLTQGQPLPNYAVPQPSAAEYVQPAPAPQQYHPQPEQYHQQEPVHPQPTTTKQQQPAGYYKPSSFPTVPNTNPVSLESLPNVPEQEPWQHHEREREREEDKVGELITF
ncbi:uncharacterized protein JCM6883_006697 [Sporobolomyces salmoneus]|uniref:uncharacterized protein n=1 Tax=Sporobolomyces salmoneus TaxID=183962 RepID=UPI00316EA47E